MTLWTFYQLPLSSTTQTASLPHLLLLPPRWPPPRRPGMSQISNVQQPQQQPNTTSLNNPFDVWWTNNTNNNNNSHDNTQKQVEKKDRSGRIVHRSITSIHQADLHGLVDPEHLSANTTSTADEATVRAERTALLQVLYDAGVTDIDTASLRLLPTHAQVVDLYGRQPVVVGLERCEQFQHTIPLVDASVGTAGLFNTGTNPLAMYLSANCVLSHNTFDTAHGMRWQV
jgi:hypothetical protein